MLNSVSVSGNMFQQVARPTAPYQNGAGVSEIGVS